VWLPQHHGFTTEFKLTKRVLFFQTIARFALLYRSISIEYKEAHHKHKVTNTFRTEKYREMSWMAAKIRWHHDRLCDGHTFYTRDYSTYLKLSTSILSKALHVSHWWHLSFHKITNLKHKFATMFIHIAYHHYVVNIYFERVQSSLESYTTSKLTDRLTPTSCQMNWHSSLRPYDVTCDTTFTTTDRYHDQLYVILHAQLRRILECLNRSLGLIVRLRREWCANAPNTLWLNLTITRFCTRCISCDSSLSCTSEHLTIKILSTTSHQHYLTI
jgi:hypothetical protein